MLVIHTTAVEIIPNQDRGSRGYDPKAGLGIKNRGQYSPSGLGVGTASKIGA